MKFFVTRRCEVFRLTPVPYIWICGLVVLRRKLSYYCRACCADYLVLGIRATRDTNCADNLALINQWNAASGCDDLIERERIIKMHEFNCVLEKLGWTPEDCSRFALCAPQF